jgi:hypothetical protein
MNRRWWWFEGKEEEEKNEKEEKGARVCMFYVQREKEEYRFSYQSEKRRV